MRLALGIEQHQLTWDEITSRARLAEEAGFEAAWAFDHFKALYDDPKGPCLEGWTLLAGLAAQTERLRLGLLVSGATYRHAALLAAEAVTVDHISGGRLEIGVGAAWFENEHRELGFDFPPTRDRIDRLDETVQILRLMMTEDDIDFQGRHFRLQGGSYNPKPVQKPHPPIWIGGRGEKRMLPLIARRADAWHTFGSPEDIKRRSAIVDEHARKAGRDPESILRATSLSISEPWDEVLRRAAAVREAGFSYLIVSWPTEGRARVEEFIANVMPKL